MEVSVEIHKIIIFIIYNTDFFYRFTSGGGVDDVLMRLSLIEQIIKDANLMSISFFVIHPMTFWQL